MNTFTSKSKNAALAAFKAAANGDLSALTQLADHSFNLEDCDEEGNCALHYAVSGGNLSVVRFLVEQGGLSPTWANQKMVTPFDLAHEISLKSGHHSEIEVYFENVCGFDYDHCRRNPILRGMHPDPSIVRVGEDYYLVNSSFVMFPGIPISHSRDLVHWEVIGYAVTDAHWMREHLGPLEGGRGFWAPDISFHEGRFYITATLRMNDDAPCIQQQIVTSSEKPEGPYETPVIHPVLGIDPSLFADEDGRRYMLLNRGARLMEVSSDAKTLLSEPKLIWYGSQKHAPEGPHLLKKDGYYYCFLAEGGTGMGHRITVARSRNLAGPYEDCPYNPILRQSDEVGVLQCCGHGKPVSTPDGRWFIVYLCSRFLDGKWGMLGRETCLDEITWTPDGWPIVAKDRRPTTMAALPLPKVTLPTQSETLPFDGWIAPRFIDESRIALLPDQTIQIVGDGLDLNERLCGSLLLKWQPDFDFVAEFAMEIPETGVSDETEAGLTLYYDENTFLKFGISQENVFVKEYVGEEYTCEITKPLSERKRTYLLKIVTTGLRRDFFLDGRLIATLENVTCICSEGYQKGKRFTGAAYGVYTYGKDCIRWRQHSSI